MNGDDINCFESSSYINYNCDIPKSAYSLTASYVRAVHPLPDPIDKGVVEFFEKLGYSVQCDSSRRSGEFWYDISDGQGLVVQIDQGVPLDDIVTDICRFYLGEPGISKYDYKISGPDSPSLKLLFKRIYDWKMNRIEPNGQTTFKI